MTRSVLLHALLAAASLAGFAARVPALPEAPPTAEETVARVRGALGLAQMPLFSRGVRLTGTCDFLGQPAEFELITDDRARFVERIAGRISVTYGSDGSVVWTDDIGRERRAIECGDRESAVLGAGIITGRWFADGAPITFTLHGPGADDHAVVLDFQLSGAVMSGTVEVDTATWLPRRWSFGDGVAMQRVDLAGTVSAGPVTFPREIRQTSSGGLSIVVTVDRAAEAPSFVRSPYELVTSPPEDVRFTPGVPAALEVRKAPTGHLLVHPSVNGKDVGWFIFDTGAGSNCMDQRAAAELGLETFGSVPASGVGGTVVATFCAPDTLALGPVTLEKSLHTVLDFAFLDQYMGTKVAGIIGYGLLHRVVAEFDIAEGRIALHDPAAFDDAGLTWQKLTLYNRHPCVEVSFEDHTGLFKLDTGAQGTVTIHYPAVERWKLLDGRPTTDAQQGGVGGSAAAKAGTLASFTLGGRRTENVPAIFAAENKGAFADRHTAGNIGGTLLRPFKLVFDYQRSRIAFVPR